MSPHRTRHPHPSRIPFLLGFSGAALAALLSGCDGGGGRRSLTPDCVDSDGDTACDADDACPGTPAACDVDALGCPVDSDGDTVCDGADLCPATALGCAVDATGCPTIDSDGDGVCDGVDTCPGTAAGCDVNAAGCPSDSDGDGVCDGVDLCPGDAGSGACPAGPTGCPPSPCGQCDAGLLGDTSDGNTSSCWHVTSLPIGQGSCNEEGNPIDLEIHVEITNGAALLTINTCQNASCQGGQQAPLISPVECDVADACGADPTIATCTLQDSAGNVRTVSLQLQGNGDVDACVTNLCGETVCKTAQQDADGDCDLP